MAHSTPGERRRKRNDRALEILNGLYNRHDYLPIMRGPHSSRLVGAFDIILCPLENDCLPILARVVSHEDGLNVRQKGNVHDSFGLVRKWIAQTYPGELAARTEHVHVWLFGYMRAIIRNPRLPTPGDVRSLMCGWKFNWSDPPKWEGGRSHYWHTADSRRVVIPRKWSRAPQRWIQRSEDRHARKPPKKSEPGG